MLYIINYKCFSKRVAKRIPNLQGKFINTRMTSFLMYVSVSWGAVIKKNVSCELVLEYENYLHDFVAV